MGMQPTLRFSGFEGDWSVRSIRDLGFEISDGNYGELYPKSDEFVASGVPFIRANNMNGGTVSWSDMRFISPKQHAVLKSGHLRYRDILVTTRGDIGTVSLVPIEFEGANINAQICLLRNATAALQEFVFFALIREQARKQFKELQTGSALKQLPRKNLSKIAGYYPPMAEQTKIAEFLGAVDEKIRLLEARLEQLTLYKKAMMQKIFSQAIRFKRVDGGDYPDWETKTLNELTEIVSGLTYSPSDVVSKGTLVLRSSNVQNGKLDFNDCVFVEKKIPPNIMSQEGDILLCVRNGSRRLIGKSAYVGKLDMPATHGAFMSVLRAKNSRFVFQLLNNERFLKLVHMDLGATINSINTNNLKKYNFFVPSSETEQQKIANFLSSLDDKIAAVSAQITQMQNFKKGLLQQMFV